MASKQAREPSIRKTTTTERAILRADLERMGAARCWTRTLIVPTTAANRDPDPEAVTSLLAGDAELG